MQPIDVWQVENLRLTFFFDTADRLSWLGLWTKITGQEPENRSEKLSLMQITEDGIWREQKLLSVIQHDRIDIFWCAVNIDFELPNAGKFIDVVDLFCQDVLDILSEEMALTITRAAFGAVLLCPTENHEKAYELLSRFLSSIKIDLKSREFFYQINNPVQSLENKSMTINRLTKWSAIRSQFITIASGAKNPVNEFFASRLELDINSVADILYSKDHPISQRDILEFVDIAKIIAQSGN